MPHELKDDPVWVERMSQYFDNVDKDNDGKITIEQIQTWASSMEQLCKATPVEMVAVRALLYQYWGELGLHRDVWMTKEMFIEAVSKLGKVDLKRKKSGVQTLLGELSNAWFDVVDQDNDGSLTLQELEDVMIATSMNKDMAKLWLESLDKDHSGVIDREEYLHGEHTFWYRSKKQKGITRSASSVSS